MNDVYCSTKFTELQIHVPSRLAYNCCKAYPERINLDWLEQNPGKLFQTPTMVQDRTDMLAGKRCKSCDWGCYQYEDQGLISKRMDADPMHIKDTHHPLIRLQISLSTDCNLTCAYCYTEWSTAWHKDIEKNGKYEIDGFEEGKNNNWEILWSKLKQKNRSTDSRFFKLLLREIALSSQIKEIILLGGEPLLNNGIIDVLEITKNKKIVITTGLGVSMSRLEAVLRIIKDKNVEFAVSAESTETQFELIRYGASWQDFLEKIDRIKSNGNKIRFNATVNNLSIFSIKSFYELFGKNHRIDFNPLVDRPFLQANVLDDRSKQDFIQSVGENTSNNFYKNIIEIIRAPYDEKEKQNLAVFLQEFSRRRNLSLNVFPEHFIKWLGII